MEKLSQGGVLLLKTNKHGIVAAAAAAGLINGLFGAGGGMVLVPLLTLLSSLEENRVFPVSISIILPICVTSLTILSLSEPIPWQEAFPYLIGSAIGGVAAGLWGKRIPVKWLHRGLGILIIWGGIRYIC